MRNSNFYPSSRDVARWERRHTGPRNLVGKAEMMSGENEACQ